MTNSVPVIRCRRFAAAACLAALCATFGCAAQKPPARVQDAIRVIHRHLAPYVEESNQALRSAAHPDAEKLSGTGERLVKAVEALERWAIDPPAPPSTAATAPEGK